MKINKEHRKGPRQLIPKAQQLREARARNRTLALKERKERLASTVVSMFSLDGKNLGFIASCTGVAYHFVVKTAGPARFTLQLTEGIIVSGETDENGRGEELGEIILETFDTINCLVTEKDTDKGIQTYIGFLFRPTGKEGVILPDADSES